jgi:hypothetical protein
MRIVRNPGRVAGLWYVLLIIVGPLRLIYIPSKLFVQGDAAVTVSLIFLTLAFYRLFVRVDRTLATLVVILGGVMPAVIYFVGVVDDFGTLMVVKRADFLSVFDDSQRDALAMLFLKLRDAQNTAAEVLWGVWLFPLALLVYRDAMATVSEHGIYDLAARYTLRDSIDALAGDQRREAARSGRERIAC